MMKDLEFLEHVIDQKSQMILDANDRIWEYAELAYHETRSADLLCQILKDEGFSVTTGDAGIPTCFTGTFSYGSGKPVMGILGEYDALSSLSQKAASPRKEPGGKQEHPATAADTAPWAPVPWPPYWL